VTAGRSHLSTLNEVSAPGRLRFQHAFSRARSEARLEIFHRVAHQPQHEPLGAALRLERPGDTAEEPQGQQGPPGRALGGGPLRGPGPITARLTDEERMAVHAQRELAVGVLRAVMDAGPGPNPRQAELEQRREEELAAVLTEADALQQQVARGPEMVKWFDQLKALMDQQAAALKAVRLRDALPLLARGRPDPRQAARDRDDDADLPERAQAVQAVSARRDMLQQAKQAVDKKEPLGPLLGMVLEPQRSGTRSRRPQDEMPMQEIARVLKVLTGFSHGPAEGSGVLSHVAGWRQALIEGADGDAALFELRERLTAELEAARQAGQARRQEVTSGLAPLTAALQPMEDLLRAEQERAKRASQAEQYRRQLIAADAQAPMRVAGIRAGPVQVHRPFLAAADLAPAPQVVGGVVGLPGVYTLDEIRGRIILVGISLLQFVLPWGMGLMQLWCATRQVKSQCASGRPVSPLLMQWTNGGHEAMLVQVIRLALAGDQQGALEGFRALLTEVSPPPAQPPRNLPPRR
jgi:hypothetical protein